MPRYRLGLLPTFFLAVLMAGVITGLCLWVQPNSLRAVVRVFWHQPLLIVLNCLPIGLLLLAFTFIFRNVFSSASLVGTCCAFLSMANRIKLEVRDEPLFPRDFALLKEAGNAVGSFDIHWPWAVIAVILLFMLLTKACARLIGCKPFPVESMRNWGGRIAGCLACVAVLSVLILTIYSSNDLYNSFSVSNPYYIPSVFNEMGFPYCFCHQFTSYAVDKPSGFSRTEAENWETGETSGKGKDINVIMVQNEAFSDITDFDAFTYSDADDPLQHLHAAQQGAHCISGHVVVPGFAGGTANTEFDILTGMQTNALSASTTSAFRAVNRNLDSLYRVFSADGYATEFIHPGYAWFYNRENVYRWLGADQILFAKDLSNLQYKGSWVTDAYLAGLIKERYENAVSAGSPLFNFTVTIQNHMSYTPDKYGPGYVFPPVQTSADLSDEAKTLLSVYIEGVRDADAMLGDLTDYFSSQSQPVVLMFWGDHLPYLGDDQLAYHELGINLTPNENGAEGFLRSYETPYVIWANDAAAEALDWDDTVSSLDLPADGTISACYLGATLLELTGRGSENPWFHYLTQVRRTLPVIQKQTCAKADGTIGELNALSDDQQAMISKLRCWSYYKLKYKDVT
jgi:phosphoglycerol transferase MdoB-like AlkP superfamily enzyme